MAKTPLYYRYEQTERGLVTLIILSETGDLVERSRGKVREMYHYRQSRYPKAHNYRHHFQGETGCPTCEMEDSNG